MTEPATLGNLLDELLKRLPLALNSMDLDWEIRVVYDSFPRLKIRAYIPKERSQQVVEVSCLVQGESLTTLPLLAEHITKKFKRGIEKRYVVYE